MSIYHRIVFLLAIALFAGCTPAVNDTIVAEIDDPGFREARRLKNQGRPAQALVEFRKVIERRPDSAPESHFEAGYIFETSLRQPLSAIYHYEEFLRLQPHSPNAARVRERIEVATRQFASTLPGGTVGGSELLLLREENSRLQQENDTLRRELNALVVSASRIAPAPGSTLSRTTAVIPAPQDGETGGPVANDEPTVTAVAPPANGAQTPAQTAVAPARGGVAAKSPATATKTSQAGRTHAVTAADNRGLFAIARQYYGSATNANVQAIVDANPTVLTEGSNTTLKPGMVLRIP